MMKNLLIYGASGFGREVAWLVERINRTNHVWNLLGYIDDNPEVQNKIINGYKVLGTSNELSSYENVYVVCAIGSSKVRKQLVKKITELNSNIKLATLIDPSVEISDTVTVGEGCIICANSILTVNINVGKNVIINLDCTIGHDAIIKDFVTLYPSVNVSGSTLLNECCELGTGSQIIQGKIVGRNSIVGAGAVIIKDIPNDCTAVGCPATPVKFN